EGGGKGGGGAGGLIELGTGEDCMAIMARWPPSQQPVAMPMPSSSVLRVTRPILPSASIRLRSLVRPPSGTVHTVAMSRSLMTRNTSCDQCGVGGTGLFLLSVLGGRSGSTNADCALYY